MKLLSVAGLLGMRSSGKRRAGTAVTDIIVASNRIWSKDSDKQEEATFVDVTIWGKASRISCSVSDERVATSC